MALLAGAAVELGQQPALTPGFRAGVRFGGATLTGLVEAALTLPSRQAVTGGAIDTFFVGGDLGVCAGAWRVAGCALVRAGGLQFRGEGFADSRSGWLPSVSAGARATFEWPADTLFALQASAELRVPIVRLKLSVGDERVWEQGWVTGNAAAALVVRIP
ncbi:MAG: hypothetical protein IPJ65_37060 [Archangiaceae bacterium]|nr:hypothetical protein [Archangiaceae bacterium]